MREEYIKFQNARLEKWMIEWLKKEKKKYKSWNIFFRELINRYKDY